jgi:hypothetical protein
MASIKYFISLLQKEKIIHCLSWRSKIMLHHTELVARGISLILC